MEINGVLILWLPDTVFALGLDTYHWLSSFASRHVSDFPTWVKVGDRRASGILSGPLSTSCYLGFSINLRYRAISTTVFLRFTDLNLRNFWRTAFVASWIFVGDRFPTLFDGRISLLRGHSSAINGFRLCRHHRISLGRWLDSSATTKSPILPEQRFSFQLQLFGFAFSSFVAFEFSIIFRLAAVISPQEIPRLVVF